MICKCVGLGGDWGAAGSGARPHHDVSVGGEVTHAVDAGLDAGLEHKVALTSAGKLPAPEDVLAQQLAGQGARVLVGDAGELGVGLRPLGELVLAGVCRLELGEHGLVVGDERVLLLPLCHLLGALRVAVGLGVGVGGAHDEDVVAGVLVRLDQLGGLGVGARNDDGLCAADVGLQARRHEAVDVLARRHKHLAAHVPALLGAVALVLKVDTGRTGIDHGLGEAHDGSHAAVASVAVGNDRAEVVDVVLEVLLGPLLLELLAVMELLGAEEALHVLGHGVEGIVGEVRAGLHDGRVVRGRLPARHVDGLGEAGHLRELRDVKAAEGGGAAALLAEVADELEELGGREGRRRARPLDRAAETRDVLGGVVAVGALETVGLHPLLDLPDTRLVREHVAGALVGRAHTIRGPAGALGRLAKARGLGVAEALEHACRDRVINEQGPARRHVKLRCGARARGL